MIPSQHRHGTDRVTFEETAMHLLRNRKGYGQLHPDCNPIQEWGQKQKATADRCEGLNYDESYFFSDPFIAKFPYLGSKSTHVYNLLVKLITSEYSKRGFHEAVTPNMYANSLWEPIGRWQFFSKEICRLEILRHKMRTANCSGHCLFYGHQTPSYAELPIRYADFGVVHRTSRVCYPLALPYICRLMEDDSHIFCRPDQIVREVKDSLDFVSLFYERVMKFKVELELSTRSTEFAVEKEWNDAEEALKLVLEEERNPFMVKGGAAPYYGPRIDIVAREPHGRFHLYGWIQLDFELPQRFNLEYIGEDGQRLRPVLLHRAMIAPVELFVRIIGTECGGLWPFWLSLQQVSVVPVSTISIPYACRVVKELLDANFEIEADFDCIGSLSRRIKITMASKYTFILVVGRNETMHGTVNVRTRNNRVLGEFPFDEVLKEFRRFVDEYYSDSQCFETFEKKALFQKFHSG